MGLGERGMDRVLLLEASATRRRAVRSLLAPRGYDLTEASDYAQALEVLRRQGETVSALRAIVLGWPELADGLADQTALLIEMGLEPQRMNDYLDGIRATTAESAAEAYRQVVDLDALSLVVVGDADALTEPIREAGFKV